AAAVGRCALAVGVGRLARRGGIRAFGIRADVVARVVVVAGGLEIAVAGRRVFQLVQVHRIGALGARRHVGDLAFSACGTDRDAVLAVGFRPHAQRHAVVRLGDAAGTQRRAVLAGGRAEVAERGGIGAGRPRAGTYRSGVVARGLGREEPEERAAADRHALRAGGHRRLTQRDAVVARGHAVGAECGGVVARRRAPAAYRGA